MELYEDAPISDHVNKRVEEATINEKGDYTMANDFGTQDIITGRGLGVGGFGYGDGYGPFASPATNAIRLNRNNQRVEDQGDHTREVMGLNLDRISDQNAETRELLRANGLSDRLRDIDMRIADNARNMDNCCCETKLLIKDTTIDNLRSEAATNNKNEVLNAMNSQTTALTCAINSLGQVVQSICAPACCPQPSCPQ